MSRERLRPSYRAALIAHGRLSGVNAVTGHDDGSLSLIDSTSGAVEDSAAACTSATDVSEDPATGRWVVTCGTRGGLEVLDCR